MMMMEWCSTLLEFRDDDFLVVVVAVSSLDAACYWMIVRVGDTIVRVDDTILYGDDDRLMMTIG